MICEI